MTTLQDSWARRAARYWWKSTAGPLCVGEVHRGVLDVPPAPGLSIHEISYRACFKPQLPRFFIERLTRAGDVVYDPFSGRGTTVIEAGLLGRQVIANDANPLSRIMTEPRFFPPTLEE